MSHSGVFKILSMILLLSACAAGGNQAPVQERGAAMSSGRNYHIVARGETLYSIAWRYAVDYKSLARRNRIDRSYTIYPGQTLYLDRLTPLAAAPQPVPTRPTAQPAQKPVAVAKPVPAPRSKTPTVAPKPAPKPAARPAVAAGDVAWQWPVNGPVISHFSSQKSLNKGVDLRGRLGEPVLSAAAGTVVYAGSGIRGYGNLLIIKHSERYLSAYAHSRRLLVKEKESVKAGQKIAEMGNSGTDQTKLHFEIRRDGKPVDPLLYLPKR
nr:peptidoglycan DD-metalloendopeptidase family protein [Pseudomaricurvus sp. HS19]